MLDLESEKAAFRVLGGKDEPGDINTLTRLGWWNSDERVFLVNAFLSAVKPGTRDIVYFDKTKSHEGNIELVIIEGLSAMEDSDFKCFRNESGTRVEDGVSFNWAHKARTRVPNACLHYEVRGESGSVDFYLNSSDTAIELMLNATQTADPNSARQSQDIDEHRKRFSPYKYQWKNYVLFNFAMKGDRVVLPRDTSVHDKVYTFVRSTNTLYRGNNLIRSPAIPNLSGGSYGESRSFSTILRAGNVRGIPVQLSMLRHFMTCLRRW